MEIDSSKIGKLTLAKVCDLSGQDVRQVKRIDGSHKQIQQLDDLSACVELTYLDVSKNLLKDVKGIFHCKSLTTLNVSNNSLQTLGDIWKLRKLSIVNAGHNEIASTIFLDKLKNLKVLILNNNNISQLTNINKLKMLNTLILSNNQIEQIDLSSLVNLRKLSLSHNKLRATPDLTHNVQLKDVRLNDNRIAAIQQDLHLNSRLQILDLGNNRLKKIQQVTVVFQLKELKNLNLKGNTICDDPIIEEFMEKLPKLLVFNSKRILDKKSRKKTHLAMIDVASENEDKQKPTDLTTGRSNKLNDSFKKLKKSTDVKVIIRDTNKRLNDLDTTDQKKANQFGKRKRSSTTTETANVSENSDATMNSSFKKSKKPGSNLELTTTPPKKKIKKVDTDNKSMIPSDAKTLVTKKLKKKMKAKDDYHKSAIPTDTEISLTRKARKAKRKDTDNDSSSLHTTILTKFTNGNNDKCIESDKNINSPSKILNKVDRGKTVSLSPSPNPSSAAKFKITKDKKIKALKKSSRDFPKPSTTDTVKGNINVKNTISESEMASKDAVSVDPTVPILPAENRDGKSRKKLRKSKKTKALSSEEDSALVSASTTKDTKSSSKESNKAIDTVLSSRSGVLAIKKQRLKKQTKDKSVFDPDYLTDGDKIGTGGDIKWE